jgi:hypothetical protein
MLPPVAQPARQQEFGVPHPILALGPYCYIRSKDMAVEQGQYVGIDIGKQTLEMAIITRSGKFRKNEEGSLEPEKKTTWYNGATTEEGLLKL